MKSSIWLSVCAIIGATVWAETALAQAAAQSATPHTLVSSSAGVSLRTALDAAWQRAVASRESAGQRRRAEADLVAAQSLWASPPALELSHRTDRLQGNAGKREFEVGVAVPLWLPGQRAARVGAVEAAAAQALAAGEAARLRLAGELREVAWQLAQAQAEAAQADALAQSLKQLANDVERRVQAGDLARSDALAAQAEQLVASTQQFDVRQRQQVARARWALLTGSPGVPDVIVERVSSGSPATAVTHPELQLALQSTETARKRVNLMRHSLRDAPELNFGLRHELPGRGESSQGSLVVGVRLPFGTDDRNLPLAAAALAELDVAETHEQRLRERLDSEVAAARDAQRAAEAQLEVETARALLLRERAALIDKSFRAGETPLPDQLRAVAAAGQADGAVARQTAALGLARARLQQALGLFP